MTVSADDAEQVHRALQAVFATYPTTSADLDHASRESRRLISTAPIANPEDPACWPFYHVLATDVRMLLSVLPKSTAGTHEPPSFRRQILHVIRYLFLSGQYDLGRTLARTIRSEWETALGENNPDTLDVTDKLAACTCGLGNYSEARALWEHVLERRRRVLGADHPDTLMSANNLATGLMGLREYEKARALLVDVLRSSESLAGRSSRASVLAASNLGKCLFELNDYKGAREAQTDALQQCVQVIGRDHPEVFRMADDLAKTLRKIGDRKAARALDNDTRQRRRQVRLREEKEPGPGMSRSPYFNPDAANAGFFHRIVGDSIVAAYVIAFGVIIAGNLAAVMVGGFGGAALGCFIGAGVGVMFCLFDVIDIIRATGGIHIDDDYVAADFRSAIGMVCLGVVLSVTLCAFHLIAPVVGTIVGSVIGMLGAFFGSDIVDPILDYTAAAIFLPAQAVVALIKAGRRGIH